MVEIRRTDAFDRWLKGVNDTRARAKIVVRIERLASDNPGDVAPIGEGISEMRIHYGPGYRVYFKQQGQVVLVLFGGIKNTQPADIVRAKALARTR
jgi:putative addiction module killer protein